MRRVSLLWQFNPPLMTILVVSLLLVTGFTGRAMRQFMEKHTADNLEVFARALVPELQGKFNADDRAGIQDVCHRVGLESGYRLTIIRRDGLVVGDSDRDPELMENHADRPEIAAAINGQIGTSQRYSSTLGHQRIYVAVPGLSRTDTTAPEFVVRTSVSLDDLSQIMGHLYGEIALVSLALLLLTGLLAFLLARRFSASLQRLQAAAEAFAAGRLDDPIEVNHSQEINAVAGSMNNMATQLAERIRTVENQRNEMASVLSSMNEGVLAVDPSEMIIRLNDTAATIFGCDVEYALGRSIQEICHHPEITRLTQKVLQDGKARSWEIQVGGRGGLTLQSQASSLVDLEGRQQGTLLVFSDITELRRLENMRRDFVANVSHELKTPVTSIKGFCETLLDEPSPEPEEQKRFLMIINKQTNRLENIINDLLALSRLEEENRTGNLEMVELSLYQLLDRVARDLESRNPEAAGRLEIRCPEDLRAPINAPLLEQAVGNLIDNALKYSPDGSPTLVSCEKMEDGIALNVIDQGPGIQAEHLPRLFERFYRVDKARSRRIGGTGLGLAIVKHITQIHGGQATVESQPGQGSTFTLKLPLEVQE